VPVVFHNFRGYDGHFIVKEMRSLGAKCDNINPISQNSEKFMSFKIDKLKFIDSMLFLNSSLESLSENLVDDKHDDKYHKFTNMKSAFGENIELMCRKGIYPYEWMDNVDKFNYVGLPSAADFYSKLNKKHVKVYDFIHACNVYKELDCKTFEDYHMAYFFLKKS
jgi:hypothetical protein